MGETGDGVGPVGPEGETGDDALTEETKRRIGDVCAQIEVKIGELKKILDNQATDLQKMDPGWADAKRGKGHTVSSEDRNFLDNFEKNYDTLRTESENTQDVDSLRSVLKLLNKELSTITARIKGFESFWDLPDSLTSINYGMPRESVSGRDFATANPEKANQELWQAACGSRDTLDKERSAMIDQVQAVNRKLTKEEEDALDKLNTQAGKLLFPDEFIEKMKVPDLEEYNHVVAELTQLIIIFTHSLGVN